MNDGSDTSNDNVTILLEGDVGIIIVDTTESGNSMAEIWEAFREITMKPVAAIIYTHFHTGKDCTLMTFLFLHP